MTPAAKKYKKELESAKWARESAERELKRMKDQKAKEEEEKKKRWSATLYCAHCLEVTDASCPPGLNLEDLDCLVCRVRGYLHLVRKVRGEKC